VPASLMLGGEKPGEQEGQSGRPFVGPARKRLDTAFKRAGLERTRANVTNAGNHFKWEPLVNRRLHKKPTAREMPACRPWLLSGLALVRPRVVVSLGATATTSLLGQDFHVTESRGQFFESEYAPHILVTVHPSAILRSQDAETRKLEFEQLVEDLR